MNTKSQEAAGSADPAIRQGYTILHIAFVIAPIVAGADKFFNLLVDWEQYLPDVVADLSPISPHGLMMLVGVVEIIAGIGVAWKVRVFAYIVAVWFAVIIVNLALIPGYFDIMLRDFGLLLGALALARISAGMHRSKTESKR